MCGFWAGIAGCGAIFVGAGPGTGKPGRQMRKARVPDAGTAPPRAGQIHAAEGWNRTQRRFPAAEKAGCMADRSGSKAHGWFRARLDWVQRAAPEGMQGLAAKRRWCYSNLRDAPLARLLPVLFGALNSAVECHLHTVEVAGSNPAAPTINSFHSRIHTMPVLGADKVPFSFCRKGGRPRAYLKGISTSAKLPGLAALTASTTS